MEDRKRKQTEEEFNALPTNGKIRSIREAKLRSLLNLGYIDEREFKAYEQLPKDFITDRKSLIANYYCLEIDERLHALPTTEYNKKIRDLLDTDINYSNVIFGGSFADGVPIETQRKVALELSKPYVADNVNRARNFVDYKRNRILTRLQGLFIRRVVLLLLGENDTPSLIRILVKQGYRVDADSLNDKDRGAIERGAINVIWLLELAMLNGLAMVRYEEFSKLYDTEGNLKEAYHYRDGYDELLLGFEMEYRILLKATMDFYTDKTTKGVIGFLNGLYDNNEYWQEYSSLVKGTKFEGLIDKEGNLC